MLSSVDRLKKNGIQTVVQFAIEQPIWVQRVRVQDREELAVLGRADLPPWTKLRFLGFVTRGGKSYPIFRILRFDSLVDMAALDVITPAIQTARDFGRTFVDSLVVLEPEQVDLLDV